ncbi:3-hydroxybutyrate dehydrogenase [Pararhodospirillum oryzae]|uniref:3-hydroxybutyrate dehydrogenase n=1 Tax=Pararhodospirillum oryzae TaxID=478448 RepID=A0A512H9G6_9PROT|nr:3-hydroxybutyrate dehydrogenase [Pararhodospirillum oryzae]GEO82091.1 3-hydroxybutyrate dehydrogenase [Pararhodospirillum oryzae]
MTKRRALITGSTSGIGLGVAQALAAAGHDVALSGFGDPEAIERLRHDIETSHGVRCTYRFADLSDPAACRALVADTAADLGGLDILVNNAGIQHVAPIPEFPAEKWDQVIAVNLSAVFHCSAAVLPGMIERDWGRIINIASAHGLVASVNKSAYVAAKHGVVGLTKVAALENAKRAITVNAICPGWVLTPLVQRQIEARAEAEGKSIEEASQDLLGEKQPSGRFVTPEQIGAMAVFLCSDPAASITGTTLSVDGGWTAQ